MDSGGKRESGFEGGDGKSCLNRANRSGEPENVRHGRKDMSIIRQSHLDRAEEALRWDYCVFRSSSESQWWCRGFVKVRERERRCDR